MPFSSTSGGDIFTNIPGGGGLASGAAGNAPAAAAYTQGQQQMAINTQQDPFLAAMQNAQLQSQIQQANIAAQASMYPATLKQQRFQQVFPYMQNMLNNLSGNLFSEQGGGAGGPGYAGGVSMGGGGGSIFGPGGVQQMVNQGVAQAQQGAATNIKNMQQSLASKGYGANSPLAQALTAQYQAQGQQQASQNALNAQMGAAGQQAQLAGQLAGVSEAGQAAAMQAAAQRYSATIGAQNALVAALSGLMQ